MPDPDLRALLELDGGWEAATACARQLALRRLAAWLADEGELDADPLAGLNATRWPNVRIHW